MNEFPILLYTTPEGSVKVNAVLKDESLWLTQGAMAELFGVQKAAISKHLKNIFVEGELDEGVVVPKMETTTPHGAIAGKTQGHAVNFYNLDAIIAVGYRVNSRRATQFRIWATKVLREYIVKGFALDDDRRVDRTKPNIGLTTWKNAPDGRILKSDVMIAKNYLDAKQIRFWPKGTRGSAK